MPRFITSPASLCRSFRDDRRGNIAVMFAIALVPILGLIGLAVDFSRISALRAKLQTAADMAALAASKTASSNPDGVDDTAKDYFKTAVSGDAGVTINSVDATYSKSASGSTVAVTASATYQNSFLGVLGITSETVSVSSTTSWGSTKLRVALVLDNTGSMADSGKLTALKTATKNLLAQLKGVANSAGDVYVSIIPFVKDVNVGSSYYGASWIDWTDWDEVNGTCSKTSFTTRTSCTNAGKTWTAKAHSTWNGCIADRGKSTTPYPTTAGGGYDQIVDSPGSSAWTLFPAEQYPYCPQAMLGLKDVLTASDYSAMTSVVDSMVASGSTNQPIGLVWGWQSLVGGGPLSAPSYSTDSSYTPIIILLTDGLNTQDRWYGNGSSTSTSVDYRMYDASGKGTCANIKNAPISINGTSTNIVIYTVQVNTDGAATSTLLQNCASSTDTAPSGQKFFLLTSASQIITTFDAIGTSLSKLRVSQ